MYEDYEVTKKSVKKAMTGVVAIVLVAILCLTCITVIPSGHTGVVTVFGKVSSTVMQEGFHVKAPWQSVHKMDNRVVKLEVSTEAFSKDLQTVETKLAVNYRLDTSMSFHVYKNIGKDFENTPY